jgi:uncharacterized hydrophobic protein (TIGR00271 family)
MKKAIQAQLEKITHAVVERIKKDDDDSKPAPLTVFSGVKEKDKAEAIERLIVESTPRGDFFFLILLSVLMATFGLYADSPEVVIGSMLIAPLLSPILSLAMGVVMADQKLIARSLLTLLKAVIVAVLAAAVVAVFMSARVSATPELTTQMSARTRPDLVAAAIALIAGLAASLALGQDSSERGSAGRGRVGFLVAATRGYRHRVGQARLVGHGPVVYSFCSERCLYRVCGNHRFLNVAVVHQGSGRDQDRGGGGGKAGKRRSLAGAELYGGTAGH